MRWPKICAHQLLRDAVRAVAAFRGVALRNLGDVTAGYGSLSQAKWAAWRRKNNLEGVCEELLDDQMKLIVEMLNPVFEATRADPGAFGGQRIVQVT